MSRRKHTHHIVIPRLSDQHVATTLASAVSQVIEPGVVVEVTVVVDRDQPPPAATTGENVRVVEFDAAASHAARANYAVGLLPTAATVRFLADGEMLAPRASIDDVHALRNYAWCSSVAAESDGTSIVAREQGAVETGAVLDEWAAETVALTIHPNTAAYDLAFFAALGGFSAMQYGHQAELLARASEAAEGTFRAGSPSMTLEPTASSLRLRPAGFGSSRRAIADMLIAGRKARLHARPLVSGPKLWDEVSDLAWKTYTEGNEATVGQDDDLWDVLTQARKYHFRFAWDSLVTYIDSAEGRFDDDYLTAMLLTGRAAHSGDVQSWQAAIDFIEDTRSPRLIHLFLTVVFETGTTAPRVLAPAIRFTQRILDIDPADPVAHYRMVSFHRFAEDWPAAAMWRRKALDSIAAVDPGLQDHLRERMIVETTAILPNLRVPTALAEA